MTINYISIENHDPLGPKSTNMITGLIDDAAGIGSNGPDEAAVRGGPVGIIVNETSDAAGDASTGYSMSVGDTFAGNIDAAGDRDWVQVTLTAGHAYEITLNGVSLSDPYLRLYDSAGNLVDFDDDSGFGLDSLLQFLTGSTGTYYIAAGAYGDFWAGTYEMTINEIAPPTPLDAIDWGGTVVPRTSVTVYFAHSGETYDGVTSDGWTASQKAGVMAALNDIAAKTGLTFTKTTNAASATFKMVTTADGGVNWAAYMNPPNLPNPGVGVFNTANMDLDNLIPGSWDYSAIQHEAGHGLGMAHPHDTGGGSVIMEGVTSPFNSYGLHDLNQGVFTMMSYNDGYHSMFPVQTDYGSTVGPMAFDIALLQQKYGGPTALSFNNGNTFYDLPTANRVGTYFECIWDDGGKDTIRYAGTANAIISLVAATLDYSPTGGGVVSHAAGIQGGYTIANGVVIENAKGGNGNDEVTGNGANNGLWGGNGRDSMNGGNGKDRIYGQGGNDTIYGGGANDRLYGNKGKDTIDGGSGKDTIDGGEGNDILTGGGGLDVFTFSNNFGTDTITDFNWANGNEDINLKAVSSITGYNDLVNNHMSQVGMNTVIDAGGGNVLTILNTAMCALGADDFIF